MRRRLEEYGSSAGNDGQPDGVLERIRGQARIGRSDARRRATSCCKDWHGSGVPRVVSTTYEELKHDGVGLNMGIVVMRAGHDAHIRSREMDASMGALGWQVAR